MPGTNIYVSRPRSRNSPKRSNRKSTPKRSSAAADQPTQQCRLDHPGRTRPVPAPRRPTRRFTSAHPRPRQPIHRRLRRDLPNRRPQDPQDPRSHASCQFVRRTLDWIHTPRTPRPNHHLEPTPTRTARHQLHRPLQRPPTSPLARPAATADYRDAAAPGPAPPSGREIDPMRRAHQRVPKGRLTSHDRVSGTHKSSSRTRRASAYAIPASRPRLVMASGSCTLAAPPNGRLRRLRPDRTEPEAPSPAPGRVSTRSCSPLVRSP